MIQRTLYVYLLASVAVAGSIPATAASSPGRYRFDVPAQGRASALLALSQQSGVRILFPYDAAGSAMVQPIHGVLTMDEALIRVMKGSPLRLASVDSRLVAITAAPAAPEPAPDPVPDPVATPAATGDGGDTIIVTGTRAIGRTVADSLAPIDVVGKKDFQTSGKQSVRDLLGTLVPSISVSNSGAGASFAVKTLSLRGLSGDQVLVLVNGKRRHNTATLFINGTTQNGQSPPDLDLIPASAIERIEVLRDGASAQYGSDAIAGVINIILKKTAGGSASMLLGGNGDGGGLTGRALGDVGFALPDGGHIHISADGYTQGRTVRGTENLTVLYPLVNGQPDPREATANRKVNKPGQPQVVGGNVAYDAAIPVGGDVELYSFGTYSSRHADSWLTFRNPNAANNIIQVYPDGYVPRLHIRDEDFQVAGGLRGTGPAEIGFDLSTTYSENKVDYDETTALNASLGPASPTTFYIGLVKTTEWTSNLDLTRKIDLGLFAEPLFAAVGGEYRRNSYTIGAGEPASYIDGGYRAPRGQLFPGIARQAGSQGVTGFPPDAAGTFRRHSWSAYINLEQTLVRGVDVAVAGRHEDYSDFGTTDTGKASLRIAPTRWLALRGTASTGFRAPTLQQQHYASSSTIGVTVNGVSTLLPVRALPVDSPPAVALGATPLRPEKSTNFSAGIVLTPTARLNITVDAYQIKIRDRILLTGTLSGAAVNTALAAAGITSSVAGFYFTNAADTRTRGLDVVATYRADLGGFGKATASLSGNLNKTKFLSIDLPPPALAAAGLVLIDRARQGDFTRGTPRDKEIANINWELGRFTANVRATRFGKVTQVVATRAADGVFHDDTITPKVIVDLEVGYKIAEGLKISAGANNLLNTYPTVLDPLNQGLTGFSYYNPYSPYGISGGFYYGRINFDF
jgi:iron complex outermembrane receptor protein